MAHRTRDTTEGDILASIFASLEGPWKLERRLNSANKSEPAGRCHGLAHFTSRSPSSVARDGQAPREVVREMLYHEEGQFQMQAPAAGVQMPYMTFSRNYVWRLNSATAESGQSSCSLWFTKPGTEQLDYLFHSLLADGQTTSRQDDQSRQGTSVVRARGSHLCVEDQYETGYTFAFVEHPGEAKLSLATWQTVHTVLGPQKDQRIETIFTRDDGRPSD